MPRRTGEQTKDLLIRTGIAMLLDRGITAGVSHIRLQEVVRRAEDMDGMEDLARAEIRNGADVTAVFEKYGVL